MTDVCLDENNLGKIEEINVVVSQNHPSSICSRACRWQWGKSPALAYLMCPCITLYMNYTFPLQPFERLLWHIKLISCKVWSMKVQSLGPYRSLDRLDPVSIPGREKAAHRLLCLESGLQRYICVSLGIVCPVCCCIPLCLLLLVMIMKAAVKYVNISSRYLRTYFLTHFLFDTLQENICIF